MSYTNPIDLLESEERELEERIFGTPKGDPVTTDPEATTQNTPNTSAQEPPELVTPAPPPQREEGSVDDWEKRYKNLRSSRDENLWKTKTQLSAALETINTLQGEITRVHKAQPKVDPLEGIFTDEDTETLGSATVDAVKRATVRATEAATRPLQEQLELERKKRSEQDILLAQQAKQEAYGIFISRVAQAVPNWEQINFDPTFVKWMEDPDFDGTPRKVYFQEAEGSGNSALIIRYMREYEAIKPRDLLAAKVAPVGDSGSTANTQRPAEGQRMSRQYIDKFYDDLSRGRYRGRHSEAQAIETAIDKAVMEGRVVA